MLHRPFPFPFPLRSRFLPSDRPRGALDKGASPVLSGAPAPLNAAPFHPAETNGHRLARIMLTAITGAIIVGMLMGAGLMVLRDALMAGGVS